MTDMADGQVLDEGVEFEQHRRYLSAVAYRLLGSLADAEDAVQDAWLRWQSVDHSTVRDPRAFLTTVVTRICYDQLGSARVQRESYFGEWLPEPSVTEGQSPEDAAALGESVSYAMLAVMEQLSPAERVALVLHDVFAIEFDEIAAVLDRTPESVRQLASRGRRRVRDQQAEHRKTERGRGQAKSGRTESGQTAQQQAEYGQHAHRLSERRRTEHRKAVAAFAAACMNGDIPGLMLVLDPDVTWHSDGGGIVRAGARPVVGAEKVARVLVGIADKWIGPAAELSMRLAEVNGELGVIVLDESGATAGVVAFEVADDGRITHAYAVVNPEKLAGVVGGAVSPHLPRRVQRNR